MISRSCLKVLILLLLISICLCAKAKKNKSKKAELINPQEPHNFTRSKNVIKEMPTKKDLVQYLKALNKIVKFCDSNRNEIDLNFAFGLFLINVNLKTVVRHKSKHIPVSMLRLIKETLSKNDEILGFFAAMVKRDTNPNNKINKLLFTLFSNETIWIERIVRYDNAVFPGARRPADDVLERIYSKWDNYRTSVDNWNAMVPNEQQSDECIASLAHNSVRVFESLPTCNLVENCYNIIVNGSDFGYALTHRMLLMLTARYGRGCAVFSPTTDKELMNRFCTAAYAEAEYIAAHNFGAIDLLMEQISFCALDGHVEFLRRSWTNRALRYQLPMGCFGPAGEMGKRQRRWTMSKIYHEMEGGFCNGHLTATAAATLATSSRFIIASSPDRITENDIH